MVPIRLFKIYYQINFVSGILKDLSYECDIAYPMSSYDGVVSKMEDDIKTQRVITGNSSNFVISSYRTEIFPIDYKEI